MSTEVTRRPYPGDEVMCHRCFIVIHTESCVCVERGQKEGAGDPGNPERDGKQHQDEDGVGLVVVIPDVFVLDGEDADEDDEEDDVGEGEEVVTGAVVTPRHQPQPLQRYHNLVAVSC